MSDAELEDLLAEQRIKAFCDVLYRPCQRHVGCKGNINHGLDGVSDMLGTTPGDPGDPGREPWCQGPQRLFCSNGTPDRVGNGKDLDRASLRWQEGGFHLAETDDLGEHELPGPVACALGMCVEGGEAVKEALSGVKEVFPSIPVAAWAFMDFTCARIW